MVYLKKKINVEKSGCQQAPVSTLTDSITLLHVIFGYIKDEAHGKKKLENHLKTLILSRKALMYNINQM